MKMKMYDLYRTNHQGGFWLAGTRVAEMVVMDLFKGYHDTLTFRNALHREGVAVTDDYAAVPVGTDIIELMNEGEDDNHGPKSCYLMTSPDDRRLK